MQQKDEGLFFEFWICDNYQLSSVLNLDRDSRASSLEQEEAREKNMFLLGATTQDY